MSSVQLLFTRRRHPGSALIRVTTWSAWSHVDLIDGQSVLGAVAFHGVEREMAAWAFHAGGRPLFRPDALYRVTPQHLWMLPHEVRFIETPDALQPV